MLGNYYHNHNHDQSQVGVTEASRSAFAGNKNRLALTGGYWERLHKCLYNLHQRI